MALAFFHNCCLRSGIRFVFGYGESEKYLALAHILDDSLLFARRDEVQK